LRRSEEFVEEIAELWLEHVDLNLSDRNTLGPIVGNGPILDVVLDWATDVRPPAGNDVEIVRQRAAFGAAR
jgi:hypothetical protein